MGIVDDLKSELHSARAERQWYEADWQDYVTYTAPDMERAFNRPGGVSAPDGMSALRQSAARERSRKLYDPTAVWLLDRLASGVGSLTMPEGFNWHGVGFGDPFAPEPSQADEEFFELVRDHLFRVRYSGRSGFALANRSRLLSTVKLGTGVLFPVEKRRQPGRHPHADPLPLCAALRGLPDRGCAGERLRFLPRAHAEGVAGGEGIWRQRFRKR
ncbi:portal protein [Roseibium salinum]|nr:portal protein [Roseibium salinum]